MSPEPRVASVILAAGASRRMGRDKLSLDLGRGPLVRLAANLALSCGTRPIIVVTRGEGLAVRASLRDMSVDFVRNDNAASGMASSLREGLAAVPAEADAALVFLGDMPDVRQRTVAALLEAFAGAPRSAAVLPVYRGAPGNPVLLSRLLFPAAMTLTGDEGARRLLRDRGDVLQLPVDDPGIHLDLDDQAAVDAYRRDMMGR